MQDPFNRNRVDKVILNVIHHTPLQLEEVLPYRTIKKESLHDIFVATVDRLQTGDTLLRYLEAMKIDIRRPGIPKVRGVKVISLGLVKTGEEGSGLACRIGNINRTATNLKLGR